MAVVITHKERSARLLAIRKLLDSVTRRSRAMERLEASMIDEQQSVSYINTEIQAALDALADDITVITDQLSGLSDVHRAYVTAGMPPWNSSLQLLKTNNGYGIIQPRDGSNWSGAFANEDVIKLTDCEDAENDGVYTVDLVGGGSGQPELVQQPNIDAATGFTVGSNWSISGGKATHSAGSTDPLSIAASDFVGGAPAFVNNAPYIGVIEISDYSAGTLTVDCGAGVTDLVLSANGEYSFMLKADGTSFDLDPSSSFIGAVTSLSIVRVLGVVFSPNLSVQNATDTTCVVTLEER